MITKKINVLQGIDH